MSAAFDQLLSLEFAIAAAATVIAGLMRGFTGFGSSMLLAPTFSILFGPFQGITMITTMEVLISVQLVPRALKGVEWRFVGPMALAAVLAMPLGNWILRLADQELLIRAMGGVVLVITILVLAGWGYRGPKTLVPTLAVGALSGWLTGATGMGGPPVLLYVLLGNDRADTNRSNLIIFFTFLGLVLFTLMIVTGLATAAAFVAALALLPVFVGLTWAGQRLFDRSSERLYRLVALLFLCAVGVYALVQ